MQQNERERETDRRHRHRYLYIYMCVYICLFVLPQRCLCLSVVVLYSVQFVCMLCCAVRTTHNETHATPLCERYIETLSWSMCAMCVQICSVVVPAPRRGIICAGSVQWCLFSLSPLIQYHCRSWKYHIMLCCTGYMCTWISAAPHTTHYLPTYLHTYIYISCQPQCDICFLWPGGWWLALCGSSVVAGSAVAGCVCACCVALVPFIWACCGAAVVCKCCNDCVIA